MVVAAHDVAEGGCAAYEVVHPAVRLDQQTHKWSYLWS